MAEPTRSRRSWVTVPVIFWSQCGEVVHLDNHIDTLDSSEMNSTLFAAMNAPM